MHDDDPIIRHAGDSALTIQFGERIDHAINQLVIAFADAIEKARLPDILEVVPTYRSVTVYFDPLKCNPEALIAKMAVMARQKVPRVVKPSKVITVPVVYGDEFGPDIDEVAALAKLSINEVIELHSCITYRVFMLGFSPGFPYLGVVSEKIAVPRLPRPRKAVPAGSIGIAGSQTAIYPVETPGGWRLVGRTPLKLFTPNTDHVFLLAPGDSVKFLPITRSQYLNFLDRQDHQHAH